MRIKDESRSLDVVMQELVQAIDANDKAAYQRLYQESLNIAKEEVAQQLRQEREEAAQGADAAVLRERGSNVLTSAEQKFYNEWIEAMKADNPKQAVENLKATFPETVVERVMEDLRKEFPLLNAIRFINTSGLTKFVLDKSGEEEAIWGDLCDEIIQELSAGFETVTADLFKLSAFLPVCEQGLTFGPNWLDAYLRAKLYNAVGNGAVRGFVDGTGKKEPIGMTRVVGPTATVVNGVYPRKAKIAVLVQVHQGGAHVGDKAPYLITVLYWQAISSSCPYIPSANVFYNSFERPKTFIQINILYIAARHETQATEEVLVSEIHAECVIVTEASPCVATMNVHSCTSGNG